MSLRKCGVRYIIFRCWESVVIFLDALAWVEINKCFSETKMSKKASVKIKSHIAKGDSQTVIEISVK